MRRGRVGRADGERRAALGEAEAATRAREEAEAELRQRMDELAALNAELFAAVRKEEGLEARVVEAETALADMRADSRAAAIRDRTDNLTGGDNVRKALAAAEAKNAELETQLAALEEDYARLRVENGRIRRMASGGGDDGADSDVQRRLGQIASAVQAFGGADAGADAPPATAPRDGDGSMDDLPPRLGEERDDVPVIERAAPKSAGAGDADDGEPGPEEKPDGRSLAERIRALQQPAVRS